MSNSFELNKIKGLKAIYNKVLEIIGPDYSLVLRFCDEGRHDKAIMILGPLMEHFKNEIEYIFKDLRKKYLWVGFRFHKINKRRKKKFIEMSEVYGECVTVLRVHFSSFIIKYLKICEILVRKEDLLLAFNNYCVLWNAIIEYPHQACILHDMKQKILQAYSKHFKDPTVELELMTLGDQYFERRLYYKARRAYKVARKLFKQFRNSHSENSTNILINYQKIIEKCNFGIIISKSRKERQLGEIAKERGKMNQALSCFGKGLSLLELIPNTFRDNEFKELYCDIRNKLISISM